MAALETDTMFYRWDHPNGFVFSAGNEPPSEADGWRAASNNLPDGPPVTYECTSLRAFQALLDSERRGAREQVAGLNAALEQAHGAIRHQHAIIQGLEAEIAALSSQGG